MLLTSMLGLDVMKDLSEAEIHALDSQMLGTIAKEIMRDRALHDRFAAIAKKRLTAGRRRRG